MADKMADIMGGTMGVVSGRIQPTGYIVPDGSYVLCLGSDVEGLLADLDPGDSAWFYQYVDVTSLTLITFRVKFVQPDNSAGGITFSLSVYMGSKSVVIQPPDGSTQEFITRAINVTTLTGLQTLYIRLEAV